MKTGPHAMPPSARQSEIKRQVRRPSKPVTVPMDVVVRETDERLKVAVAKIHNLQSEVISLRDAVLASNRLFLKLLKLLDDPSSDLYAEAVKRDYFHTRPEAVE